MIVVFSWLRGVELTLNTIQITLLKLEEKDFPERQSARQSAVQEEEHFSAGRSQIIVFSFLTIRFNAFLVPRDR